MRLVIIVLCCALRCLADYDIPTLGEAKAGMVGRHFLTQLEKVCMDGKNQKTISSPEDSLYMECAPWKSRSCCTRETTESMHVHPFEIILNPCEKYHPLSDECRKHFRRNFCFYECSPNVGPWISSISKARFYKVPLCKTECDNWYKACENDYTCFDRWIYGDVIALSSVRNCEKSDCIQFKTMYNNSQNMCEVIWDHSWEYVTDHRYCMNLWFETSNNPNERVTQMKIIDLLREYDKPEPSKKKNSAQLPTLRENPPKRPKIKYKKGNLDTKPEKKKTSNGYLTFAKLIISFIVVSVAGAALTFLLVFKFDRPAFDQFLSNYRRSRT